VATPAVNGDPTSITLSFDLEKPALVHYSFTPVETGNAETIKGTAISTIDGVVAGSIVVDDGADADPKKTAGSPIAVVETVGDFAPGTQYKLEIVTETLASNGVFGPVLHHEGVETHALAPAILSLQLQPVDAEEHSLSLKYMVGESPSSNLWWIAHEETDLFFNENGGVELDSLTFKADASDFAAVVHNFTEATAGQVVEGKAFGVVPFESEELQGDSLREELTISSLQPGVHYCVYVVTETVDSHGVMSEVSDPVCAMTHPSAPPVREEAATVVPAPGSTTSILLFYTLLPDMEGRDQAVDPESENKTEAEGAEDANPEGAADAAPESTSSDLVSADMYTAKSCSHFIHFAVHKGKYSEKAAAKPGKADAEKNSPGDILSNFEYGDDIVAKGTLISMGGKSSATITGLITETEYYVLFMAETAGSNGVYGPISQPVVVRTHAAAPMILERSAVPMDGSSSSAMLSVSASVEGDVHFVVVPRGHPVSGPSDIVQDGDAGSADNRAYTEGALNDYAHVDASTGAVVIGSKSEAGAQTCPECERGTIAIDTPGRGLMQEYAVGNLEPGTPYDVYFVSETMDSRGVYGKVSAALPLVTHAVAPDILSYVVTAEDAESEMLRLAFSLGTSGVLHYAVVIHSDTEIEIVEIVADELGNETATTRGISAEEVVAAKAAPAASASAEIEDGLNLPVFLAVGQVACYSGLKTEHVIAGLPAGTKFDIFLVSETIESGGVYGEVNRWESANTHAVSPALSELSVSAINGTAVGISMVFSLSRSGEVHYMIVPVNVEGGPAAAVRDGSSSVAVAQGSISVSADTGLSVSTETAGSAEDGSEDDDAVVLMHVQKDIYDLEPGIAYFIHLVPETSLSNGVFGDSLKAEVVTHRDAPTISGVAVYATDGTCSGLTIDFTMNEPGVLHYLVLPHSSLEATQSHAWGPDLIANPEDHMADHGTALHRAMGNHFATHGSEEYATEVVKGKGNDPVWNPTKQLKVDDLQSNRQYAVWLVTETSSSFGVYGKVTVPQVFKTHPEAPDTFEEPEVDCADAPDCDDLQRVPCGLTPPPEDGDVSAYENTCGPCYPGHIAGDDDVSSLPGNIGCVDCQNAPVELCSPQLNRSPCGHVYGSESDVQPNKCGPCLQGFVSSDPAAVYGISRCLDCRNAPAGQCASLQRDACGAGSDAEENVCGQCLAGFVAVDPEDTMSACTSCAQAPECGSLLHREACGAGTGADTCGECLEGFFFNADSEVDRNTIACFSCQEAPDCTEKNRLACGSVGHSPNVCGPCLHGFVGIAGSGNTQCVADVHPDSSQHDDTPAEETPETVVEETPDAVADIAEETSPGVEDVPVDQNTPVAVEEEAVATEAEVAEEADNEEDECPLNAHMAEDGCQCDFGFDVNEEGTGCESVCPLNAQPDENGDCECSDG
jgi:hypothetical protein